MTYLFIRPGRWSDRRNWANDDMPRWWKKVGEVHIHAHCVLDQSTPKINSMTGYGNVNVIVPPRTWFGLWPRWTRIRGSIITTRTEGPFVVNEPKSRLKITGSIAAYGLDVAHRTEVKA